MSIEHAIENSVDISEITRLPKWAKLALVGRCARRDLPSYKEGWTDSSNWLALSRAIESVEFAASSGKADLLLASEAVESVLRVHMSGFAITLDAARSTRITLAATLAYVGIANDDDITAVYLIIAAMAEAVDVSQEIKKEIRDELQLLSGLALREQWNDDTPVSQKVFDSHIVHRDCADPPLITPHLKPVHDSLPPVTKRCECESPGYTFI